MRSVVSGIASEASAVRHSAHLGQGSRNALSAPDGGDRSPFAALLDDSAAPPAQPAAPPLPTSQKPATRPQDGTTPRTATEASSAPQKPSSDNPAPQAPQAQQAQTANVPATSSTAGQKGADIATAALAALARKVGKATDANPDTPAVPIERAAPTVAVDTSPQSTDAAPADTHDDKEAKSGAGDSASTPPDASAVQQPATPQPVAAALALPVVAAAPVRDQRPSNNANGDANTNATTPDASRIAALSGAIQAATPRRKADATNTPNTPPASDNSSNGGATEGSAKPAAKPFDATRLIPSLTPQPSAQTPPTIQPTITDGSQQPRTTNAASANQTNNHARQLAAPAADASVAAQTDATPDPAPDPSADAAPAPKLIADITRQALDPTVRRSEKPTTELATAALPSIQTGTPQAADPAGSAVAPALVTSATADATAPATAASPPAVPIAGIAVEIAAQAQAGKSRFDIRLDPPELGRIDVRLDVDRDGKVTSRVIVDRPETLDILRRDASEIERSLQQAGLKTADNNALQFSLRDNGTSGGFGNFGGSNPYPNNNGSPSGAARVIIPDRDLPPVDTVAGSYGRTSGAGSGIDIRV
jgi:flagellar hook-length control protein FliK